MEKKECPLCRQSAECDRATRTPDRLYFGCRFCGNYGIEQRLTLKLEEAEMQKNAFRAACIMHERRLRKDERLYLICENPPSHDENEDASQKWIRWQFEEMVASFPKPPDLIDRALTNLSEKIENHAWDAISYNEELQFVLFCPQPNIETQINYMSQMAYIERIPGARPEAGLRITPQGWKRIHELRKAGPDSRQAFVAMWCDSIMDAYEKAIKGGIEGAKYEPMIIRNKEHNNDIRDEIMAEIRKSRFVVADFTAGCCKQCNTCEELKTCRDMVRPRGGVYFEAGFAMGLGIPVIWVVHEDQLPQIHFDTRNYKYITYKTPDELQTRLRQRIEATIV